MLLQGSLHILCTLKYKGISVCLLGLVLIFNQSVVKEYMCACEMLNGMVKDLTQGRWVVDEGLWELYS